MGFHEKPLRETTELIERWTESDLVDACRKDHQADPLASDHIESYHLLKRDPLWCGLLLYNFRMVAYEGAIVLTNSFFSIQAAAHLYNALRQMQILEQCWTDMEYVLKAHEITEIFLGSLPCSPADYFKHFLLAYGVSAQSFARNQRPTDRLAGSPRNAKKLQRRVPVCEVFKNRFCSNDGRTSFEPEHLDNVLLPLWECKGPGQIRNDLCASLIHMAVEMHGGSRELAFGYFNVHKTCCRMLSSLVHSLSDNNADMRYLRSNPKHLPESVGVLLADNVNQGPSRLSGPTKDTYTAAALVEQILRTAGQVGLANMIVTLVGASPRPAARANAPLHDEGHPVRRRSQSAAAL
ncbi:hypothetical protein BAUCODRAFT_39131 [Baudoinia panamericana UAMH 10762]|uniref:Uncharacterized protein n=1 Tax=Baudoinia panamericana (strain UAMH 10762) TaxID=717646 RepID=M2MKW6_BAUPA|nr:uncharacterized protein BAUCODRAFT_39131 [Baudoinia panamericana UAMH 10762]EMC91978.1 hypothetical protein BAUCODRAFT_39131 [Baudoinia panamericana UAMH 10762]